MGGQHRAGAAVRRGCGWFWGWAYRDGRGLRDVGLPGWVELEVVVVAG